MAVKNYLINDKWLDIDKQNIVEVKSTDGVIESIKLNGEEYGGGETWNTVFEGNVTTVENEKTGTNSGSIELDELLPETIKVIFNGTEYICNMNTNGSFGAVYNAGRTDFTDYPFSINNETLYTETAGTYTLKIERRN